MSATNPLPGLIRLCLTHGHNAADHTFIDEWLTLGDIVLPDSPPDALFNGAFTYPVESPNWPRTFEHHGLEYLDYYLADERQIAANPTAPASRVFQFAPCAGFGAQLVFHQPLDNSAAPGKSAKRVLLSKRAELKIPVWIEGTLNLEVHERYWNYFLRTRYSADLELLKELERLCETTLQRQAIAQLHAQWRSTSLAWVKRVFIP